MQESTDRDTQPKSGDLPTGDPPTGHPSALERQPHSQTDVAANEVEPLTDIKVQLGAIDGNSFAIIGHVSQVLRMHGRHDLVTPFQKEATSGDYDHLLATCQRYVRCS